MKYKKLLKKAAVSLLLAQSLIFTGLPIQAADIAGQSMVWTESSSLCIPVISVCTTTLKS